MKEKIHYKPVLTALHNIIEQTKKKGDNKAICLELEEKIQELVENKVNESDEMKDRHLMPPPATVPSNKKKLRQNRYKNMSDEDEDDSSDDSEEDVDNVPVVKCEFQFDLNYFILCV